MSENVRIDGLAELGQALRQLPQALATKALRGAVASAAAMVRKEAVALAPQWHGAVSKGHPPPGTLKKAIYQARSRSASSKVQQTFIVGVRAGKKYQATKRGKKEVNLDAYYWRWVEFGTSHMAAKPFLRPGFETQKSAAAEEIRVYLTARLPALVADLKGSK